MTKQQIWQEIEAQTKKDKKENPGWPEHVCGQSAKVSAAAGLLSLSSIDLKYRKEFGPPIWAQKQKLKESAVNTIVQALRFLEHLK